MSQGSLGVTNIIRDLAGNQAGNLPELTEPAVEGAKRLNTVEHVIQGGHGEVRIPEAASDILAREQEMARNTALNNLNLSAVSETGGATREPIFDQIPTISTTTPTGAPPIVNNTAGAGGVR